MTVIAFEVQERWLNQWVAIVGLREIDGEEAALHFADAYTRTYGVATRVVKVTKVVTREVAS